MKIPQCGALRFAVAKVSLDVWVTGFSPSDTSGLRRLQNVKFGKKGGV